MEGISPAGIPFVSLVTPLIQHPVFSYLICSLLKICLLPPSIPNDPAFHSRRHYVYYVYSMFTMFTNILENSPEEPRPSQ